MAPRKHKFTVRRVRKLTDSQVDLLRSELRAGGGKVKMRSLARKYGVSQAFVSYVKTGKTRTAKHTGIKDVPTRR